MRESGGERERELITNNFTVPNEVKFKKQKLNYAYKELLFQEEERSKYFSEFVFAVLVYI